MTKLLTFLVPTYNRRSTLEINLRKNLILCRRLNRKLLVIDNGSNDQTEMYCKQLLDEFAGVFFYFRNQYNFGLGYSIWKGVLETGGFCFLLSDEDQISESISKKNLERLEYVLNEKNPTLVSTGVKDNHSSNSFTHRNSSANWDNINYFEDGYLSGIILNYSFENVHVKPSNFCDPRNLYPHLTSYFSQTKKIYRFSQQFVCTNDDALGRDYLSKEWFTGKNHWHHSSVISYILFAITTFPESNNLFEAISNIHFQYFLGKKTFLPISTSIIGTSLEYSHIFFLKMVLCYLNTLKEAFMFTCKRLIQ